LKIVVEHYCDRVRVRRVILRGSLSALRLPPRRYICPTRQHRAQNQKTQARRSPVPIGAPSHGCYCISLSVAKLPLSPSLATQLHRVEKQACATRHPVLFRPSKAANGDYSTDVAISKITSFLNIGIVRNSHRRISHLQLLGPTPFSNMQKIRFRR
jgi:hypothetical protein